MRRWPLVYFPSAQRDLIEAFDYIRRDSPADAASWLSCVDQALRRLELFPQSGLRPKDQRLADLGYRIVVLGEYLAFYKVRNKRIEIRRVLHGKRLYSFLLDA